MKYSWIFVALLLCPRRGRSAFLDVLAAQRGSKSEDFGSISADVEAYFEHFMGYLEYSVLEGSRLLADHMADFIERPDVVPEQGHGPDCEQLFQDVEKFIDYLEFVKEEQLNELIKSFNRLQSYFKVQLEICDTVRYEKERCEELMISLYKIRFSVLDNRLKVFLGSILQFFDSFSEFLFNWLPVKDADRASIMSDHPSFDELNEFLNAIANDI